MRDDDSIDHVGGGNKLVLVSDNYKLASNVEPPRIPYENRGLPPNLRVVGGTVVDVTREEIDSKLALSDARTDTKFARLEGKIDLLIEQISGSRSETASLRTDMSSLQAEVKDAAKDARTEGRTTRITLIVTAVASVLAILAVMIGIMQYGASTWYNGTVIGDQITRAAQEAAKLKQ